ncbi:11211_t:CDS:2, partial [Diversispora eburnea]
VAERSKLSFNLNTRRKINIQRCLSSCEEFDSMQSIIVVNTWTDKIDYEFTTDSKAFALGDRIPIHMTLIPLEKNLSIVRFNCKLMEYITYQIGTQVKEENRMIRQYHDMKIDFNQIWDKTFEIILPDTISLCRYDSQSKIIKIQHKLKFSVIFNNSGNEKDKNNLEIKADLPIIITPVSSNSDHSFLEIINPKSLFDESKLNSLPSYRSIASSIPAPLADSSLPPIYSDQVS